MNIVTEECGIGAAILIRALQPELGISQMLHNRPVQDLRELTNGPGKLCQAMGISKLHDGCSLIDGDRMWLEKVPPSRKFQIQTSPRIGISQARELPLRYFVDGHRFVSGRAADHSMPRTWVWDEHKSSS
jgi:DNA-3-methyladenine glycosylase